MKRTVPRRLVYFTMVPRVIIFLGHVIEVGRRDGLWLSHVVHFGATTSSHHMYFLQSLKNQNYCIRAQLSTFFIYTDSYRRVLQLSLQFQLLIRILFSFTIYDTHCFIMLNAELQKMINSFIYKLLFNSIC